MIRYDLKCQNDHAFEAWFASATAFEEQAERSLVACPLCGSTTVEKALMAPGVPRKSNARDGQPAPKLNAPVPAEIEQKLSELRREVEANSDYVGGRFAAEARKMHVGDAETRSIWGEATGEEAKSLIEDGVPIAPLPVKIKRDD